MSRFSFNCKILILKNYVLSCIPKSIAKRRQVVINRRKKEARGFIEKVLHSIPSRSLFAKVAYRIFLNTH